MAVNDSEKKAAAFVEKRPEKGKELEQFNEAQGQLLTLQAEQRNNLNEQRTISSMEAQNNQTLAQAAGMLAASGGAAGGAAVAPKQVSPKTSAVLNRYGVGKPGTVSKTTQNTIQNQTPQKINVVNNTSTTNNNNIHIVQPSIPTAAPAIPMRNDTERFKVWVNNAFAKQNEAAAIREKEYQKREWSLTRSANKMIRKMADIGKNVGQALNPKNLGNALADQFKVLMFLMGFQYLAKNVGNILAKVDKFVNWLTGDGDKSLKGILSSLFGLGRSSGGFLEGLRNFFTDLFERLKDEINLLLENRAKAVKSIEFPEIDLLNGDLKTEFLKIATYLGDVLGAAFGGVDSLRKTKIRDFHKKGRESSLEDYEDKYSHTQDIDDYIPDTAEYAQNGVKMSDVSIGDAVTSVNGFDTNFKMAKTDYNSFGGLSNAVGSSIKQSNHLVNLFDNAVKTGTAVDVSQYSSGLSALKSSARRYGGIFISKRSLISICKHLGLPDDFINKLVNNMEVVIVIYCIVPKSEAEMVDENAGSFASAAGKVYIEGEIVGKLSTGAENRRRAFNNFSKGNYMSEVTVGAVNIAGYAAMGAAAGSFIPGIGTGVGAVVGAIAGVIKTLWGDNTMLAAAAEGLASETRQAAHDKYTIKAFDINDPRIAKYVPFLKKDGSPYIDSENNTYLRLTPAIIKLIEDMVKRMHNLDEFSFDGDNMETINFLNRALNTDPDGSIIPGGVLDLEESMTHLDQMAYEEKLAREDLNMKYAGRSMDRFVNYAFGNGGNKSLKASMISSGNSNYNLDYVDNSDVYKDAKAVKDEGLRQRINYVMDRLCSDEELKLTPVQAAGLVGNLISESGLKPDAKYPGNIPNEGKWSRARGIAQWLGKRQENFYKKYNKYPDEAPLEDQVDFLIEELKTTHKGFLNKVQDVTNVADSASVGLYNFEFQIGDRQKYKDYIEKLRRDGASERTLEFYEEVLPTEEKRQKNAAQALRTFEDSINSEGDLGEENPRSVTVTKTVTKTTSDELNPETKEDRINYVMGRLLGDTELDLTDQQAAKLVSRLITESGNLEISAGGRNDFISRNYYQGKSLTEAPLSAQVDYLIDEIKGRVSGTEKLDNIKREESKPSEIESLYEMTTDVPVPVDEAVSNVLNTYNNSEKKVYTPTTTDIEITSTEENPNSSGGYNLISQKPESIQEYLSLQFAPTSLQKRESFKIGVDDEGNKSIEEFINPLADASAFSKDESAAMFLKGEERAWYEDYGRLNPSELLMKLSEEGVNPQRYYNGMNLKLMSLHGGLGASNKNLIFGLEADGDFDTYFGKEMKASAAEKEFNNVVSTSGLSGIITKYIKEKHYNNIKPYDTNSQLGVTTFAKILLNKENQENYTFEQAKKDLDKFNSEKLNNPLTPTLNSSIYYHTTEEQRKKLLRMLLPTEFVSDEDLQINEKWESYNLGRVKINDIVRDRLNEGVNNYRKEWLLKHEKELLEQRKVTDLENYINANLGEGQKIKNDKGEYNLETVDKLVESTQDYFDINEESIKSYTPMITFPGFEYLNDGINPLLLNRSKIQDLPENIKDLIRKKLNKESGSYLTPEEIVKGFGMLKEDLKDQDPNSYENRLNISKELVAAKKVVDLGLSMEQLSESNTVDARQHIVDLVKSEMDKDDGKSYLKEKLGLSSEQVDSLINQVKEGGSVKDWNLITNTNYYKKVHSAVTKYKSGRLDKLSNQLELVKNDLSGIGGKAREDLQKLASMPRIKTGSDEFKLLASVYGKDLSMESIPNQAIDLMTQNATTHELLAEILRNTIINGEFERCIAEINRDQLIVSDANAQANVTSAQASIKQLENSGSQPAGSTPGPLTPPT